MGAACHREEVARTQGRLCSGTNWHIAVLWAGGSTKGLACEEVVLREFFREGERQSGILDLVRDG